MPECPRCTAELETDHEWPGFLWCWRGLCYWSSAGRRLRIVGVHS